MGTRLIALFMTATASLAGCVLDRSAVGSCPPGLCADAGMGDAFMADAGDAWTADASIDPDGSVPDSMMDVDAGSDAGAIADAADVGPDAPIDGGMYLLHIRYDYGSSHLVHGFVFRIAWNEPPPTGAVSSMWYAMLCDPAHATDTGTSIECDAYAPELMPGRTVDLYPTDGMGGPLCGPSTCPDFPAMWSFSYGGAAVPAGELSLQTGPAIPPPTITGNPAYIRIGHLPTP